MATRQRVKSARGAPAARQVLGEDLRVALAKVAIEDDYGAKLLSMKGRVADDVEL